jgi:hypothetical protein
MAPLLASSRASTALRVHEDHGSAVSTVPMWRALGDAVAVRASSIRLISKLSSYF